MPIERFRTISDVPAPKRVDELDERGQRIQELWKYASLRESPVIPRGVQRFRSIDAAAGERDERTRERLRRLHNSSPQGFKTNQ